MIFKNVKKCALLITILFTFCNSLRAETFFALVDIAGSTVDLFGNHSYQRCFNQDCSRMITSIPNKVVIVWDTQTCQPVLTFNDAAEGIFSPNGELILIVLEERLDEITEVVASVHDAHTGEMVCTLKDFNGGYGMFSPDSTKIMGIGAHDNVVVWDVQTGNSLCTLDAKYVCIFSPNGKTIMNAARSEHDTKIFDAQTGELIHIICDSMGYGFNQDGNRILVFKRTAHSETQPEAMVVSLESNLASIDEHMKQIKMATDFAMLIPETGYLLVPKTGINPAKFAFGINEDQGYAILRDKETGQEKILSLEPNSVLAPAQRTFNIRSIENNFIF